MAQITSLHTWSYFYPHTWVLAYLHLQAFASGTAWRKAVLVAVAFCQEKREKRNNNGVSKNVTTTNKHTEESLHEK